MSEQQTGFIQGENWSYDSAVEIITILNATGQPVRHGWSICNLLEPPRNPLNEIVARVKSLGDAKEIPCDPITAVGLFLAGELTLDHLTSPTTEEAGRRIKCHEVKIGEYVRTLLIMPEDKAHLRYRKKQ